MGVNAQDALKRMTRKPDTCSHSADMQTWLDNGNVIFCQIDKHNGMHSLTIAQPATAR